jgi:acetylornithine deacetylase
MSLDPVHLTRSLIDIESITYNEGAVGLWLEGYLDGLGFKVERMPVPQPPDSRNSGERFNLYASIDAAQPDLVFSTHMDTVPPFLASSEDEEFIYGRGSCDAKGIIAAQIAAAVRLRELGAKVALLFVVGEERDSAGARVANENSKGSRFLINGEPTDNRLALASKGALRATFRASGKMGHSAYPELGDSAIHKLILALEKVLALKLPFVEDVGPGTLNIGMIHGGHAPNVIADIAEAHALVRLVGPSEEVRAALENAVAGLATVDFTLEIPFVRMRKIEGLQTMVAAFTTDIPALTNWGEPLLLGPGSIHVAHTPHERLAKKELFAAIDLYTTVGLRLLQ